MGSVLDKASPREKGLWQKNRILRRLRTERLYNARPCTARSCITRMRMMPRPLFGMLRPRPLLPMPGTLLGMPRPRVLMKALFALCAILFMLLALCAFTGKDGEYEVSVDMSGGSGKAAVTSPTVLRVADDVPYAQIQWSSANYDYMIVDGRTYWNESEEGMNSVFEIPVLCWDEPMEVIADTTAMGGHHEIRYQLTFYSDSIGSKGELPQEAAKRVLLVAVVIIVAGGALNYFVKKYVYD